MTATATTQRILPIHSPLFVPPEQLIGCRDLRQLFAQPDRPLALEIGCGIGDFMAELAAANPMTNFIAIDIYNKGCLKTCRRLEKAGLNHVRVLRVEARYLLHQHCPANSLSAVYINCPDPWPKKRHRDRRLVNGDFLRLLLCCLTNDGRLHFASDVADYANQVACLLAGIDGYVQPGATAVTTALPGYPLSKYMRRFLAGNLPIYFIARHRRAGLQLSEADRPALPTGFRTRHPHPASGREPQP